MSDVKIPVIVLGGTGYVSGELLRLIAAHPRLQLQAILSDSQPGEPVAKFFAHLAPIYPELKFEIPIGKNGDTYDRYLVRMEEMRQSNRILKQCFPLVRATNPGEIKAKISKVIRPPEGEVYHSIESPKGELGYYIVSDGKTQNAYRCHVRPPSFVNLQALPALAKGHLVSDLVALIGTIDIVLGEVDR